MSEAAPRPRTPVTMPDGRTVFVDDTGPGGAHGRPVVVWHHESPHTGDLYEPLLAAAAAAGARLLALTRPGYGGADPLPGRAVADGAADLEAVLDLLGIDRFAAIGGSGGGPHALAAAARMPTRVTAVATFASPAPFVDSPAWWDGMADDGGLRSARDGGLEARRTWAETARFDPAVFTEADLGVLDGAWAALGTDAGRASTAETTGGAEDDVAFTTPWGFDLDAVRCPVRVAHGALDRIIPVEQARMLVRGLPDARFALGQQDGHLSVLEGVPGAIDWLAGTLRA